MKNLEVSVVVLVLLHKIVSYLVATFSVKNSYIFSYLVEAFCRHITSRKGISVK
jgi:hypothetical protein